MFGNLIVAVPTPFNKENQISFKEIDRLLHHLIFHGADSIVVGGTTGESPTLSIEEKKELVNYCYSHFHDKLKIIVGIGTNDTKNTIEEVNYFNEIMCDGYMVIIPYYNRPPQQGIIQHFKKVNEVTIRPLMIYNVPSRVGVAIEVETAIQLFHECENIIGIKHASTDVQFIKDLKDKVPKMLVYCGEEGVLIKALANGADGVISVIANAFCEDVREMLDDFDVGIENALLLDYLGLINELVFCESNPIPIKYILHKKGFDFGNLRLPLVELQNENKNKIDRLLGF